MRKKEREYLIDKFKNEVFDKNGFSVLYENELLNIIDIDEISEIFYEYYHKFTHKYMLYSMIERFVYDSINSNYIKFKGFKFRNPTIQDYRIMKIRNL
jgi:hypothetical protein